MNCTVSGLTRQQYLSQDCAIEVIPLSLFNVTQKQKKEIQLDSINIIDIDESELSSVSRARSEQVDSRNGFFQYFRIWTNFCFRRTNISDVCLMQIWPISPFLANKMHPHQTTGVQFLLNRILASPPVGITCY